MDLILVAVISLGAVGLIAAVILYVASKKFAVYEDPRIAQVAEVLPQANCGGCGYPGCSGFAEACVKAGSLEGKLCPVGGQEVMGKIAAVFFIACGYGGENASNKSDELKGMKQIEEDFKFTFGTCYGHWYDAYDHCGIFAG